MRAAGCVYAEDEADLLIADAPDDAELERMTARRVAGEPLEAILGWAEFCGLRIALDSGVFVPRLRTSFLVRLALPLVREGDLVLDLCCGSGAVGAAIEAGLPEGLFELWAADIDPAAIRSARRNIRGTAVEGDLFAALPVRLLGGFTVIVVNAPYVPSEEIAMMPSEARVHEPRAALDGGLDGADMQRRVVAAAGDWLSERGTLIIETSRSQAPLTVAAFEHAGWTAHVERSDELEATAVVGTR